MQPIHERPTSYNKYIPFMEFLAQNIKPENYLELGVAYGDTLFLLASHCKQAIGVDKILHKEVLNNRPNNVVLYNQTTDEFFKYLDKEVKFDLIFIDADHSYHQSCQDFLNCADHICDDGIIVMHDTYPPTQDHMADHICGKAYLTALFIKKYMSDKFEIVTLPFSYGVSIIRKISRSKQILYDVQGDVAEWHTR